MPKQKMLFESLPNNLKKYVSEQNYEAYTARDHAVWRYILRQCQDFFKKHAHSAYSEGLEKTGVPIDRIPRVSEMDEKLSKYGWRAVCVNGFIPPAAFLEFQARQILPIAVEIRRFENIAYTPAPDIVHEAAGHAPFIVDEGYSEYLRKYGLIAKKAIFSSEDVALYEAIRQLSDIKEDPASSTNMIQKAEDQLEKVIEENTYVSEATLVSRLYWWSAEYGLIKENNETKIYGAGLLSSVGESQSCLKNSVIKKDISLDCVDVAFNITSKQPQLFVADSFASLGTFVDELSSQMAFNIGGVASLKKAKDSKTVNTVELNSGLQISGLLTNYEVKNTFDGKVNPKYINFTGPVQLCFEHRELKNQGIDIHSHGYSTPIGFWKDFPQVEPQSLSAQQLKEIGLIIGHQATLEFCSGIKVEGEIEAILRHERRLLVVTWKNCHVYSNDEILFKPEWGSFDMAVGRCIPSVYAGPADPDKYEEVDWGQASTSVGQRIELTDEESALMSLYRQLRDMRERASESKADIEECLNTWCEISLELLNSYSDEWLLALELTEFYVENLSIDSNMNETFAEQNNLLERLERECLFYSGHREDIKKCIAEGLQLLK